MKTKIFKLSLLAVVSIACAACQDNVQLSARSGKVLGGAEAAPVSSGTGSSTASSASSSTTNNPTTSASTSGDMQEDSSPGQRKIEARSGSDGNCQTLATTPPRGFSCLHCMASPAGEQSFGIVDMLLRSCLKNVAISYLIDGSFGYDSTRFEQHIDMLAAGGREPHVHLYLLNGPSQRKYQRTPLVGVGTQMSPEEFRDALTSDPELRKEVQNVARRGAALARYALSKGAVVTIALSLEDNLEQGSFEALRDIVEPLLPSDASLSLGRNTCPRCARGADDYVPAGYFKETHTDKVPTSGGDIKVTSNDGVDVSLPSDSAGSRTLGQLRPLRDWTGERNGIFLLWNAEQQGLRVTNGKIGGELTDALNRPYKKLTPEDEAAVIEFLKGN